MTSLLLINILSFSIFIIKTFSTQSIDQQVSQTQCSSVTLTSYRWGNPPSAGPLRHPDWQGAQKGPRTCTGAPALPPVSGIPYFEVTDYTWVSDGPGWILGAQAHMHTCTQTQMHAGAFMSHTCAHAHTHACMHAHTHACTHTHTDGNVRWNIEDYAKLGFVMTIQN